jgi:hypothetical protein
MRYEAGTHARYGILCNVNKYIENGVGEYACATLHGYYDGGNLRLGREAGTHARYGMLCHGNKYI